MKGKCEVCGNYDEIVLDPLQSFEVCESCYFFLEQLAKEIEHEEEMKKYDQMWYEENYPDQF